RKGPHADIFNLAIVTLTESEPTTKILFDHHGPAAEQAPHPPPSFPLPEACWDGTDHLIYSAALGMKAATVRVDLQSGKATPLDEAPQSTNWLDAQEARRRLTPPGNAFLKQRELGKTQIIRWQNEGFDLEGAFTAPPESVARPPYKLIVFPHGGPHSRSSAGFNFTAEVFAAHGYA